MLDKNGNVESCTECPKLVECRSRIVNGVGPIDAPLLIVGEAPGQTEDEGGEPFVGRSGTVLMDALNKYGILRGQVRISNCVRCRPPDNRNPTSEELSNCSSYLSAEIALVEPEIVLGVGRVPSEQLTGESLAVTKESGETYSRTFSGYNVDVMVGLHPAFILRDGSYRDVFEDAIQSAIEASFETSQRG